MKQGTLGNEGIPPFLYNRPNDVIFGRKCNPPQQLIILLSGFVSVSFFSNKCAGHFFRFSCDFLCSFKHFITFLFMYTMYFPIVSYSVGVGGDTVKRIKIRQFCATIAYNPIVKINITCSKTTSHEIPYSLGNIIPSITAMKIRIHD